MIMPIVKSNKVYDEWSDITLLTCCINQKCNLTESIEFNNPTNGSNMRIQQNTIGIICLIIWSNTNIKKQMATCYQF